MKPKNSLSMNKRGFILALCLLVCACAAANGSDRDYKRLLRRNPWHNSANVAGIRQDTMSGAYAEVYGKYSFGGFRESWQASRTWSAGAMTESIRHFDRFSLKGSFSFDQTEGYGMCGSMFSVPGYYPLDILEFTPGRKTRQTYAFDGGISTDISEHWRIGAKMDFAASNLAKRKDLRHTNWKLDMTVAPGLMYHGDAVSAGISYILGKNSETVNAEQVGTAESSYFAFIDKGMMYGTYAVWSGSGIHLSEAGVSGFPVKEIKNGASLQFEASGFFADLRYIHSSGTAGEKEYIWFRFPGNEAGLFAGYRTRRDGSGHTATLSLDWKRQMTHENVLEKVSGNGVASVVCHGSNIIAGRETWRLSPEYGYASDIWEIRASAELSRSNSLSSQMYPYIYTQALTAFSVDVSGLVRVWKFDVGLGCGYAGGILSEDGRSSSVDSGVQTSPFRLQDWYELQAEYMTASRINAGLCCRCSFWKGLYCRLRADWTHAFGLTHIAGNDRLCLNIGLGYEF